MEKTTNYKLPRWEKDDFVKMDDFNAAFQTIDDTLKAGADAVADEAAARETAVTAVAQALGTGGQNCRIAWGSYTGNGKYGSSNPNTLNFDFKPMIVVIGNVENTDYVAWPSVMIRGADSHGDTDGKRTYITWNDRSISWYNPSHQAYQNNSENKQYNYVVIGC